MLYTIFAILAVLLTIIFVVGTHETAHFLAARIFGVKVVRFSIGFGRKICSWHDRSGTEYIISLIPLGGYVKMLDEDDGIIPPKLQPYTYNAQPFYKKFIIVLAGPAINFLCALLLYSFINLHGFVTLKPIIGTVAPRSIALENGIKPQGEILSIDDSKTASWNRVLFRLLDHVGNQDHLKMTILYPNQTAPQTYLLDLTNWHIDELSPDPLASLGIEPYTPEIPLIIGIITANSPAQQSGLKEGDKILSIANEAIPEWAALINLIRSSPQQIMPFTIERDGKKLTLKVTVGSKTSWLGEKTGYLGIAPQFTYPENLLHTVKYKGFDAVITATQQVIDLASFNLILFGKMLTGKLSLQSLGGPISIYQTAGNALNAGYLTFLSFLAFFSVSIGIINLLPIPGLDGGHLFILTLETMLGRRLPAALVYFLYRVGVFLLIFVFIQAFVNDVLRLF